MKLHRNKDRRKLRRRLLEGSLQRRVSEANVWLPEIAALISRVHAQREEAKQRYAVLVASEYKDTLPAASPVLATQAKVFRLWATLILVVEVLLAGWTASLTLSGGMLVHLLAGIAATILFTGCAKIAASAVVDSGRLEHSASLLKRWLLGAVAGGVLICLFVGRFLPAAEVIFVIASSALSFLVALLVGVCWTLADLLAAPHREIASFTQLSLLAEELSELHALAERTAHGESHALEGATSRSPNRAGLTAVGVLLITSLCLPVDALTLWVDVSGSLDPAEFDRVRTVLVDPLPLIDHGEEVLSIGTFATELDSLKGPAHRWDVPVREAVVCAPKSTLFEATRKAREAACQKAIETSDAAWGAALASTLAEYRAALNGIDPVKQANQTCLYPLLDGRILRAERQIVITDGGHSGCGPPPTEPRSGGAGSVVILVPDRDGAGVAARMREREATIRRLYPELAISPSWKVEDAAALAEHFGDETEAALPRATATPKETQ